ncbi:MAG TPA: copper chaperone PCu(A)C [Ramlibacter sp.]|nr:copper chaperone PCu(A)C [Ramlibacter sp.]
MFTSFMRAAVIGALAWATAASAQSFVQVDGAWARVSVTGQSGSGAYMRLTAREPLSLVGVSSPVAGVAEVHEMKMDGDVMRMRPVPSLELPVGRAVELKPGGYHLMLQDLKTPLKKDTVLPLTLVFRDAKGAERRLDLQVPVSAVAPAHSHKH